jgi:hypothetical protein
VISAGGHIQAGTLIIHTREINTANPLKPEGETEKEGKWGIERHYILGGRQKNVTALKVPLQCPLLLLAQVRLREGKALGSKESEGWKMDFVMNGGKKFNRGFTEYNCNFNINVGRAALE